jgi:hypothetical protein
MHEKNTCKNIKSKLVVNNTFNHIKQVARWSFSISEFYIESQQKVLGAFLQTKCILGFLFAA